MWPPILETRGTFLRGFIGIITDKRQTDNGHVYTYLSYLVLYLWDSQWQNLPQKHVMTGKSVMCRFRFDICMGNQNQVSSGAHSQQSFTGKSEEGGKSLFYLQGVWTGQ